LLDSNSRQVLPLSAAPEQGDTDSVKPMHRIVTVRRDYNTWVANETLEDYALRFTPLTFRKWSIFRVANTAFGGISFLVLEAIGATIAVNYGFINAFWAILAVGAIIFTTGIPISYYAAKYGLDMDLLTRGAGFGYIGSTISSFIYASYTFILFALEAAIMAYALELALHIPLYIGYMLSALVVIPLVAHGVTLISRIQMITQPLWLFLMVLPFVVIIYQDPNIVARLIDYSGKSGEYGQFNLLMFGAATAVGVALITQIGEQVDYLRFMPEKTAQNKYAWNLGVLIAGPGWIFLGMLKMIGGGLLAYLAIESGMALHLVVNPTHMYLLGFEHVFTSAELALAVTTIFVVVSQLKINMTNAYAGSLAWSNFFARLTHSHPGRVVWVVFNALIAVMLMELDVFHALEQVLGLFSNIAIAWIATVVADLVINKPLGFSPKGIEFRRAYLYDINPVGVYAMLLASILSTAAFAGIFGELLKAFSAFISLFTALIVSPLIAWLTKGKYYIARQPYKFTASRRSEKCSVCEREYETEDMAHCPAYQGFICSLCCCLDDRCNDMCKPEAKFSTQWDSALRVITPQAFWPYLSNGLSAYLLLMAVILCFLASLLSLIYYHQSLTLALTAPDLLSHLRLAYLKVFAALVLVSGVIAWWLVLTSKSRLVAQEESNRQTGLLQREIELHRQTDAELQQARQIADQANQAKSRYITGISHELRTPLNSILGYAQLLDNDPSIPDSRQQAIRVIRRSGEHLLSLIEGTLDIARIEGGKLTFDIKPLRMPEYIRQIVSMFELQARNKGLNFVYTATGDLPSLVRADQKRLSQVLINILGNAVKFTETGGIIFRLKYAREFALIEVEDTGPGILASEMERIFEPFARGSAADNGHVGGTGLGLTVSKMLTELMGGQIEVTSELGLGTVFKIKLFLPQINQTEVLEAISTATRIGYKGLRRKILVVDNEQVDRELLVNILQPLGFEMAQAANGMLCLEQHLLFKPDLIFMDLAMPVMDGWEASYIIRKVRQSNLPIGIVSANAFDKGLENTAGIAAEDFLLKPINLAELLDWLGRRLDIDWIVQPEKTTALLDIPHVEQLLLAPPQVHLDELLELINIGYVRGVAKKLDQIEALDDQYALFVSSMRKLAQQFQLAAMKQFVEQIKRYE
jgi:signal transduction histidine kinase/CheY-like chemotaxis protein/purine-cytosine permease-like protein